MKVAFAADHGGFQLKEKLKPLFVEEGWNVVDVGCNSEDSVDYPNFAHKAVEEIIKGNCDRGILICGTGIGMSIVANRNIRIRAANCCNEYMARMSREHNDANVLCLGARVLSEEEATKIVKVWMSTEFAGGRHQRRIRKFSE